MATTNQVAHYEPQDVLGRPLPFRRMECESGAQAQIDFGTGAPVIVPTNLSQPKGKNRPKKKKVETTAA